MNFTRRIAQLVSNPTFVRLGTLGLTVVLGVIWGSIAPPNDGVVWGG
jgi:hypothetical protein